MVRQSLRRLKYKEVQHKSIEIGNGKKVLGMQVEGKGDDKFTSCERLHCDENKITLSWYYSYEGYLLHNEEALKKAKGN